MISTHQDDLYPEGSGSLSEIGKGSGEGYTINIPLPPGSGVGAYEQAFRQIVQPALKAYRPDMIMVSSGFDAGGSDPLGRMMMHSDGYRSLTALLMEVADELCGGKLVMAHEGGYSPSLVPYCGLAVLEQLSGEETGIDDPWLPIMHKWGGQDLQPHQAAAIDAATVAVQRLERVRAPGVRRPPEEKGV